LTLSRECGVWPDRDVIKYIRSAIAIDGLITRMAPGFDVSRYLARVSAEHLRWHMRSAMFGYDTVVDVLAAGARLLSDGLARGTAAIDRLSENAALRSPRPGRGRSRKAIFRYSKPSAAAGGRPLAWRE